MPSGFTRQIPRCSPRAPENAMKLPSGATLGHELLPSMVIGCRLEPSASMVQIFSSPRTGVVNRIRPSVVHATPAAPS